MLSCDELYGTSEIASGYETFGAPCGEREPEAAGGTCDTSFGYGDNSESFGYGDSSELDSYWDACEAGDGAACDELYFDSSHPSARCMRTSATPVATATRNHPDSARTLSADDEDVLGGRPEPSPPAGGRA